MKGWKLERRIDLAAPDAGLRRWIARFERKYGCTYDEFVSRGDFDERASDEWLDELPWRCVVEELERRALAAVRPITLPVTFLSSMAEV